MSIENGSEQKKKAGAKGKDPVAAAKLEVSKIWLLRHPGTAQATRPMRPKAIIPKPRKGKFATRNAVFLPKPSSLVVMDDVIPFPNANGRLLNRNNLFFDNLKPPKPPSSVNTNGSLPISNNKSGSSSHWSPMVTNSMTNWNKQLQELPSSELYTFYNDEKNKGLASDDDDEHSAEGKMAAAAFSIDDVEMFLPTVTFDQEYFVAL